MVEMPPLEVYEAADGVLVIYSGVTRATRIAKLAPGTLVPVQVWGKLKRAYRNEPKSETSSHDFANPKRTSNGP